MAKRFGLELAEDPPPSTGLLGDWYANVLNVGPKRYVLCLSERTFLPVILPARKTEFPGQFATHLRSLLTAIGLPATDIERELAHASDVAFTRTRSRQVLGVLNDFAFHANWELSDGHTLQATCRRPADVPSGPLDDNLPSDLVRDLFGAAGHA